MKSPDQSFTSYVQECGGIEEVRRVPKKQNPSQMSKEDYKKLALSGLQEVHVGDPRAHVGQADFAPRISVKAKGRKNVI